MFGLGSFEGIMGAAKGLIGAFKLDPSEKKEFEIKLEALLQRRDSEIEQTMRQELQAKERILVAELTQGSTYTKAARPSVVYYGLFAIFANYTLLPCVQWLSGEAPQPLRAAHRVLAGVGRDREYLVDWPKRRETGRTQQSGVARDREQADRLAK